MVEVPVKMYIDRLVKKARGAGRPMASLASKAKGEALHGMADRVLAEEDALLEANRRDVERVGKTLEGETNRERVKSAVDRVTVTAEDLKRMAEGLHGLADLPDPVGEVTGMWMRPNGMQVSRVRTPIGVIAVISDFGPSVAVESMALCLKSGNVCVLRPHSDWKETNEVLFGVLRETAEAHGIPDGGISLVERPEREAALELLRLPKLIDAIVPCGGPGLRKVVTEQARMPVLCQDGGVSYVYVDGDADFPHAQNIVVNSKAQQSSASNAADTLLVHRQSARALLPGVIRRLLDDYRVEVRGCPETMALTGSYELPAYSSTKPANEDDWGQQFLSPVISVRIVNDLAEALDHMSRYGPVHTAAIVTRDYATAMRFAQEVDASAVVLNASTRLNDGHEYGFGGQIGINTGRIHARGPLALEELTSQKYVIFGTGQLRQPHPIPTPYEDAIMLKKQSGGLG